MAPPRPKAQRRRAEQPTAKYDAAGTGRRMASWRPGSTGPQKAVEGLQRIRDRARDASRNDWTGESATQKWTTNLIGVGIRPRFKRIPEGPRRDALVDLWDDWAKEADADGVLDFYGLQTLAVRAWLESGEVFMRLRPRRPDVPLTVPFQVQLVEADYVPMFDADVQRGMPDGNRIRQGIEFNNYGRRVAYWMHREHPGDTKVALDPSTLLRVPASLVRHIYMPNRPGAVRGVSALAPVLARVRNAGNMEDAVLDRQMLANLFVSFITKAIPEDWDGEVDANTGLPTWYNQEGRPVTAMEPGTSQELMPGEDVKFANPPEAGVAHSDYMRTVHMGTSAASGLPYETFSGDIRNVSDRTLRVVILEFRRFARQRQWQVVIPMMCQPALEGMADAAALVGKLRLNEVDPFKRAEWAPEGWEHIHPVQDPQGKILEIEAGLRSRSAVIGERGDDRGTVDRERRDDKASEKRYGLEAPPPPAPGQQQQQQQQAVERMAEMFATLMQRGPEAQAALVDALRPVLEASTRQAPAPVFNLTVPPATTVVNVEPTTVNVAAPAVNVEPTPVQINVEPTPVAITNNVQASEVNVNLPDRHTTSEIERDANGNIVNVTQHETTLQ